VRRYALSAKEHDSQRVVPITVCHESRGGFPETNGEQGTLVKREGTQVIKQKPGAIPVKDTGNIQESRSPSAIGLGVQAPRVYPVTDAGRTNQEAQEVGTTPDD
jgi:hypothetical protein